MELVADDGHEPVSATGDRQAIEGFCQHVDATVSRAGQATLAGTDPDLHHAVTEWIRVLPSQHKAGSRAPAWHAGRLRTLIGRRAEHSERVVAGHPNGWLEGALGPVPPAVEGTWRVLPRGQEEPHPGHLGRPSGHRSTHRRRLAARGPGRRPVREGWDDPANLIWAIAHNTLTYAQIKQHLLAWSAMPPALRKFLPEDTPGRGVKFVLGWALVRQLFLSNPGAVGEHGDALVLADPASDFGKYA